MYFLTILPICDLIAPTQWRRQAPTVCIRTRMPASCWFQRVYAVKLVVLYCLDSTSKNILGFSILPKFVDFCRCTFSVFMGALSRRLPSKILHFPYICGVVSRRKTWKVRKCEIGRKSWGNTGHLVVWKGNWLLLRIERLFRQSVAFWLGFCRDDSVVSKASALSIFSA